MCIYCAVIDPHYSDVYFQSAGKLGFAAERFASARGQQGRPAGEIFVEQTYHPPVTMSGNNLIDSLANWTWNNSMGQSISLTFNFGLYTGGSYTPFAFSAADKDWARLAAQAGERVADITMTEVTGTNPSDADIPMSGAVMPGGVAGITYIHTNPGGSGHTVYAPVQIDQPYLPMVPGTFGYSALLHELGHAYGLKHPFDNNPPPTMPGGTMDLTVMTYSDGNVVMREEPTGYMYADVLALQYLYGVGTHNDGDTTYAFTERTTETLVDTAGYDSVYLGDSFNFNATLNLGNGGPNAGHWNIVKHNNNQTSKFNFASGTVIENAVGGKGHDAITGNEADNTIYGWSGSDTIKGKGGNDSIIAGKDLADATDGYDSILGGFGNDIIFGNSGDDTIYGDEGVMASTGGNDTLYGGTGNDMINGEKGNDIILSGPGQDTVWGGAGQDIFGVGWQSGIMNILDFNWTDDKIRILANANNSGIQTAADFLSTFVTDGVHSFYTVVNSQGYGEGILVAWHSQILDASRIEIVSQLV